MPKRPDAVSFVDTVKLRFEEEPRKYQKFLDIMKGLKGDLIDPGDVVPQVACLFNGYPDLSRAFNAFLPPGYRLQPQGEGLSSYVVLSTPEGTTVYPRDYIQLR